MKDTCPCCQGLTASRARETLPTSSVAECTCEQNKCAGRKPQLARGLEDGARAGLSGGRWRRVQLPRHTSSEVTARHLLGPLGTCVLFDGLFI